MFKLSDINEFNKRIVSNFFQMVLRLKLKANEENKSFFILCTTSSKQSIDLSVSSYFNYELEFKVKRFKSCKTQLDSFYFIG